MNDLEREKRTTVEPLANGKGEGERNRSTYQPSKSVIQYSGTSE